MLEAQSYTSSGAGRSGQECMRTHMSCLDQLVTAKTAMQSELRIFRDLGIGALAGHKSSSEKHLLTSTLTCSNMLQACTYAVYSNLSLPQVPCSES